MSQLRWLKLGAISAEKARALPQDISFKLNKLIFSAEVSLSFREHASIAGAITAHAKLAAKIPIKGMISYSIDVESSVLAGAFAFATSLEKDNVGGTYRKLSAHANAITLEKSNLSAQPKSETRKIESEPPAQILVHLLAFPALLQTADRKTSLYAAVLASGLKFQALRLERVATKGSVDTFEGRILSLAHAPSEEEWLALPWSAAKDFQFDVDSQSHKITAARVVLPLVGRIEIK